MDPQISLLIHNIGYVLNSLLLLALLLFVQLRGPGKTASNMFSLALISTMVFTVSHVIGVNVSDPVLSRQIFMCNLSVIFISLFSAHTVLAILGKDKTRKKFLVFLYVFNISLFFFYLIFPDTFLLTSVPKSYFINYYVPGSLDWLMRLVGNILIPIYFLAEIIQSYRVADSAVQNRLKYLFFSFFGSYLFGFAPALLVYNIDFNPIWSIFFVPIFAIPFTYAVLKYELMDIRIVAKNAFIYAVTVIVVGIFISIFNYVNDLIPALAPNFPTWIFPLFSSLISTGIGMFVWRKIRETDILKYEFINTISHKFRTPLTHIKWAIENILESGVTPAQKTELENIRYSNSRLVELTNTLIALADSDRSSGYTYVYENTSLSAFTEEIIKTYKVRLTERRVSLVTSFEDSLPLLSLDTGKMKFVLQTLFDNALVYGPEKGTITIKIFKRGPEVIMEFSDTGIGIAKEDVAYIFSKFFRTNNAKSTDTEGMGIGLFMSKTIIERHGGRMWVESGGINKGTTFHVVLPIVKK